MPGEAVDGETKPNKKKDKKKKKKKEKKTTFFQKRRKEDLEGKGSPNALLEGRPPSAPT